MRNKKGSEHKIMLTCSTFCVFQCIGYELKEELGIKRELNWFNSGKLIVEQKLCN